MRVIYIVLGLLLTPLLWGQSFSAKDSLQKQEWLSEVGVYAALFTGKEQTKYPSTFENHPFYLQKEPLSGFLSYDGVDYPVVGLRWNNHTDELMAISSDQRYNIVLVASRLKEARFKGNRLYYINSAEVSGIPVSGYFLKLYDKEYQVWAKPIALLNNKHEGQQLINYFSFKTLFYLQKGNTFYVVKNSSSVVHLFPDKKKELKQFVKRQKLNFRSSPEKAFTAMVQEYERLTQSQKP
ncbi:hypothetical protein [Massilibacteroides sp.]|uniref:hypothetical protein n=1 Tax=Massilibacteroides sp. TaxID=2034766 RepID=UPI002610452C|nr:hypothetical protein [Massilibacteroides sp.]MDD4515269.1 hypothetical protein [Massilibacteroides sp.]